MLLMCRQVVRSPWLQFRLFWDAHQLIFTLFLFIAIVTGIRSGFVCALWVAFACTANVLTQRTLAKYRDLPLSDHHVILVELVSCEQSDGVVPALMTFRVFSPNRISLLKDHMSTIDWSLLLSGQDATSSWNLFFGAILNLMEIYFPCKLQRCGKKWPKKGNTGSWYSPELHVLKNHVMTLHTIANCTKSPVDKQAYITARNQYKSAIRDAKKSTNEHFIDTSGNKTKAAWQVVKSLTRSSSSQSGISPSLEEFTNFYGGMVEELRQKIPSAPTSADVLLKKIPRPNFPEGFLPVLTGYCIADWRWIFIPVGVMLLPYIQNGYTVNGALLLVVPIMGRSGSGNHAELVLSLIATTMFVLLLTYIVPMILLVRNPQRVISLLSAIVFVALLTLVLTPLGFPYSSDPQNPTPQRFTIIHTDRMHHDENGAVREHKTGFWVVDMDVNSPRSVMTLVPEMAQASLIDEECRTELYCGLPYLIPVFSIVWQTHWIPGPQPNVAIKTELTLTQRELRPDNTIRLKFSVVGPDHMSLILSPKTGVRLSGWSVDSGEPLQGITFNGRPTYFIYYSYASDPEPWNFWVDFQVEGSGNDSGSGNVVDIGLSGHFLHGAHQRSVPLQRLLSKFPPWTVTTGWTAAYKSYIF
ncbi:Endoplasmic reticulum metallopeptidase 1 [Homalodisca vitripennis]|nr:Endoplasmic reticulum metallopeptidase 1 [Homalodisca vitripennis]